MNIVGATLLMDSSNIPWKDKVLIATTTYYSESINVKRCAGYSSLLILTTASITITFQVSYDESNWYDPYDHNGNLVNGVGAAIASDKWINFNPQIAPFMRFKVVCNSNATTTLTLIQTEKI